MLDLLIIGAGPAGISAAYEAKKAGLDYVVIEKGLIGNTIYSYPVGLTVFSTTNELEFNDGDLKPAREKPTREELLSYYVRFVLDNELNIQTEERVTSIEEFPAEPQSREGSDAEARTSVKAKLGDRNQIFRVTTDKAEYETRNILFAIGAMDYPRKLNVPGEDLPKVHDHFRETYPWVKKHALIIGGGNSAGEAALFLAQEGAETTLAIFREDWENNDPKQGCIKYWVKQPLEEELKEHCLKLFFLGKIVEIREREVELENEHGDRVVMENDVVFVLIGADADLTMMKSLGVKTEHGKNGEVPVYDPESFETNVPGIFVAGHFTNHRHIKGAIDAGKALIPKIKEKLSEKTQRTQS
ncbi:MAG TPA: NAD(P)-binding domain-containing protein [Pyrinomonadaceae bacterium]|nr:NAD(P)-binding domain-containing protein [Pyrinomonadaceae bacterium]